MAGAGSDPDAGGGPIVVTGASSGLGRRFAQVLAAHGAQVVAAGNINWTFNEPGITAALVGAIVLSRHRER